MKPTGFLKASIIIIIPFFITSCSGTKEAIYFNNVRSAEFESRLENLEPVIQKNDLLSITINSPNPVANEIFNTSSNSNIRNASASNTISPAIGYLVDQDGYVQLPFLGKMKAEGLTKKSLKEDIEREINQRKLLMDPMVDIRYLNYKVSVLGEVARPSVLTVPSEKITLLEALGLAGDLTIYASRNNVLLIREEQGKKKLVRIDLTSDELFTSPYYYLKSNDILYIEPNKNKIAAAGAARQWLPIVLSSLTLVVVSIERLAR